MKSIHQAITSLIIYLVTVKCQSFDEYADVNCEYQRIGSICDCQHSLKFFKLPQLLGNHRSIEVINCNRFLVPIDALNDLMQINIIRFQNINELKIQEFSFNSTRSRPSIRIEFINCNIPLLPAHFFKGRLDDILIVNSSISHMQMFALTGLFGEITSFKILNSTIGQVDTQTFRKLTIVNLDIVHSTFLRSTVSKTFYDCYIQNINIQYSRFTTLLSNAFDVKHVIQIRISDSSFGFIESESFVMDIADRAVFSNNTVEMLHRNAFKGIIMNKNVPRLRTDNVYFEFHNNYINLIHPIDDMSFGPGIHLQLSKLYFRDPQSCISVDRIYESKFLNENSHAIYMRLEDEQEKFNTISYLSERCRNDSQWFLYLLVAISVISFLTILIPAICCYLRNRRKKQLDIIMPEPRTYRQTQIIMQIENTGLMKTDF